MRDETVKYRLSLYETREVIKEKPECRIETVSCSLDGKTYIKKTYPDDRREIFHALSELASAHIPQIKEVLFTDNTAVIEEYIQGEKLSLVIKSGGITVKQAADWGKQILEALAVLHSANIIHRDVKPDNIIIGEDGNLCLIDFGIARFYEKTAGRDTEHFGTVGYAPPEQFGFSQSDFRSDLYAAGITIEEMCLKAGCSPNSAILKTARKCREFAPEKRYASANAALRDIIAGNRHVKILFIVAAVLFIVGGIIFISQTEKQEGNYMNENEIDWKHIIAISANDSSEEVWYIPIYPDTELSMEKWVPAGGRPEMEIWYELKGNTLDLTLNSGGFSYNNSFVYEYSEIQQYPNEEMKIEGEILFYDMDGEGQSELLVLLSERKRIELLTGDVASNINGIYAWCVGYSAENGFWEADGRIGPSVGLTLGNGIIMDDITNELIFLSDRFWVRN
jgi:serine/threonine protein kinase